jgi:hypothetical protein
MLPEDNSPVWIAGLYFKTLHPRLDTERLIELRLKPPRDSSPMRQVFVPSVEEAANLAISFGKKYDVYAGVATRRGEDGTKAGVCCVPALWADLDAKDGHTRESRLEQLMGLPYHPSILVWTGGGWHVYYLLSSPAESAEEIDRAERVMRRWTAGLGSDPVHDRSRILRVPGTFNHKYGEPRPVELELYEPERRYGLDQLQEMAESLPGAADGIANVGKAPREVLSGPIRKGKRNVVLASVAGSLRDRGLDIETIGVVLLEVNRLRCCPPLGDEEVLDVARSMRRYAAGRPRYRRSPVRRVYTKKEER